MSVLRIVKDSMSVLRIVKGRRQMCISLGCRSKHLVKDILLALAKLAIKSAQATIPQDSTAF